jgi:hypothetical protein
MQPNTFFHPRIRQVTNVCLTLLGIVLFILLGAKAIGHIGDKRVVTGQPRIEITVSAPTFKNPVVAPSGLPGLQPANPIPPPNSTPPTTDQLASSGDSEVANQAPASASVASQHVETYSESNYNSAWSESHSSEQQLR